MVNPERTSIVARLVWVLFVGWVALFVFNYVTVGGNQPNAMQQAALGTDTCVWLIAGYMFCRAIDSITRH
jgi:hypothetical protein